MVFSDSEKIDQNLKSFNADIYKDSAVSKRTQFLSTFRQQSFSFRNPLISYITQNPSTSKVYQKLIKCCKYFFIKNPILIIPCLYSTCSKNGWKAILSKNLVNLNNISAKFWFTNKLRISSMTESNLSFIPKIFQCHISHLNLWNQNLSYNEFIFLASKCESINFSNVTITNEDGLFVSLEKIIQPLYKLKTFRYNLPNIPLNIITTKTVQELLNIPHFKCLRRFHLLNIPDTFDIITLYEYIKENKKKNIILEFGYEISTEYKNQLRTILIESFNVNRKWKISWQP